MTNDEHSIIKNFPVKKLFNLNNHGCASLEETICIMTGHHGLFGYMWDGIPTISIKMVRMGFYQWWPLSMIYRRHHEK